MMYVKGLGSSGMFYRGVGFVHPGVWIGLGVLFVAALVVVIVLAAKKKNAAPDGTADALKLRYIKGELTEEEYLKMKDVLGK